MNFLDHSTWSADSHVAVWVCYNLMKSCFLGFFFFVCVCLSSSTLKCDQETEPFIIHCFLYDLESWEGDWLIPVWRASSKTTQNCLVILIKALREKKMTLSWWKARDGVWLWTLDCPLGRVLVWKQIFLKRANSAADPSLVLGGLVFAAGTGFTSDPAGWQKTRFSGDAQAEKASDFQNGKFWDKQ